jgi:hypothetical protein
MRSSRIRWISWSASLIIFCAATEMRGKSPASDRDLQGVRGFGECNGCACVDASTCDGTGPTDPVCPDCISYGAPGPNRQCNGYADNTHCVSADPNACQIKMVGMCKIILWKGIPIGWYCDMSSSTDTPVGSRTACANNSCT